MAALRYRRRQNSHCAVTTPDSWNNKDAEKSHEAAVRVTMNGRSSQSSTDEGDEEQHYNSITLRGKKSHIEIYETQQRTLDADLALMLMGAGPGVDPVADFLLLSPVESAGGGGGGGARSFLFVSGAPSMFRGPAFSEPPSDPPLGVPLKGRFCDFFGVEAEAVTYNRQHNSRGQAETCESVLCGGSVRYPASSMLGSLGRYVFAEAVGGYVARRQVLVVIIVVTVGHLK